MVFPLRELIFSKLFYCASSRRQQNLSKNVVFLRFQTTLLLHYDYDYDYDFDYDYDHHYYYYDDDYYYDYYYPRASNSP